MAAGRLAAILARSRAALPGSGAAPLLVLLRGRLLAVAGVSGGAVRTVPVAAACRPALRAGCCA